MVCEKIAAQHDDGEQDEFDDCEGAELAEPVDPFAHGQRVVDLLEMRVAFAPYQFASVERGDDDEEDHRHAFDRLQHEVGHGPDITILDAAGEVSVDEDINDHDQRDGPEDRLAGDIADAHADQGGELQPCGARAEILMHLRQQHAEERPRWAGFLLLDLLLFARGARGERFGRHGEEDPGDAPGLEGRCPSRRCGSRGTCRSRSA